MQGPVKRGEDEEKEKRNGGLVFSMGAGWQEQMDDAVLVEGRS